MPATERPTVRRPSDEGNGCEGSFLLPVATKADIRTRGGRRRRPVREIRAYLFRTLATFTPTSIWRISRSARFGNAGLGVTYSLTGHLAAVSAAQGEAAETAGKPTYAALTAGLRRTAVVVGVVAG
jgi:hypothetical protein